MNSKAPNLPRPVTDFYKKGCDFDGLWIPFTEYVVPVEGASKGQRLSNSDPRRFKLDGNWIVEETTPDGYPAVLRTEACDAAVAAVLNVRNPNAAYTHALVGYDREIGSFTMAVVQNRYHLNEIFTRKIPCYADCCAFESLEQVLSDPTKQTPVGIVLNRTYSYQDDLSYNSHSKTYLWYSTRGHDPWDVLNQTNLETYPTLISRYKVAAKAINKRFNKTPPKNREDSDSDPVKGAELQKLVQENELEQ